MENRFGRMYRLSVATIRRSALWNKTQTARSMYALVLAFASDLGTLANLPLPHFFDVIRKLPYIRDKRGQEVVARPALILKEFPAIDCKKKAILCASYLQLHGVPWRFMSSSVRKDKKIHHVFCQGLIHGEWKNIDPTYRHYKLFAPKLGLTKTEILKP